MRFAEAGRVLAAVAGDAPDLSARARFDPEAVTEDLDNIRLLAPLAARLEALTQRLDDSRLVWLAEAYVPALRLYKLAQVCAQDDGRLDVLVRPLQDVFAATRRRKPAPAGASAPPPVDDPVAPAAPVPPPRAPVRPRPAPARRRQRDTRVVVRTTAAERSEHEPEGRVPPDPRSVGAPPGRADGGP